MLGTAIRVGTSAIQAKTIKVYFNPVTATDQLQTGMVVCYDDTATAANRSIYVAKPSYNNYSDVAGIVAPGQKLPVGATEVELIPWDGAIYRGAQVYTDEDVADGDILGVIPGEYALGKWVVGNPLFRCKEAQTRATTGAGLVSGDFGPILYGVSTLASKRVSFFDHFAGQNTVSAPAVANSVADAGTWLLTGTSSAAAYVDSLTTSETGAAATRANGVLRPTPNTTNEASLTLNGEPFTLAAGCNLFARMRYAQNRIDADGVVGFGVGITDTTPLTSLSDGVTVYSSTAAVKLDYTKGSATAATKTTGATLVADTFIEMAFLIRHKIASTGGLDVHCWYNGTEVSSPTETQSLIPDTKSLTLFIASKSGTTAHVVSVDYIECNNYHGGL